MTTQHTPAPWVLGGKDGDGKGADGYIYSDDSLGTAVAIVYGEALKYVRTPRTVEIANARLIAAAPELLEALKEFSFMWNSTGVLEINGKKYIEYPSDAFSNALLAIAKAEGK